MASKASKAAESADLYALGARVVSVFGPFNSRVLIEMAADTAALMFPGGSFPGPSGVSDAIARDLEELRQRDSVLAESALAASARVMARELDHPYNSANAKSLCQARLADTMRELRALAPPEEAKDGIDQLAERRAQRRDGVAETADLSRP